MKKKEAANASKKFISVVFVFLMILAMCITIIVTMKVTHANNDISNSDIQNETTSSTLPTDELIDPTKYFVVDPERYDPKCESSDTEDATEPPLEENESAESEDEECKFDFLTDDEIRMLATLVYLEGGTESIECQEAIASVVINRMLTQDKSMSEVIYAPGQFSVAYLVDYYTPDDAALGAVMSVVVNGTTVPKCVTYFRSGYYHEWNSSRIIPFCKIDNTYFSYDNQICDGNCEEWMSPYATRTHS